MIGTTLARRNKQRPRSCRGAAIVETALILSIALVFLFGVFEFGRVLMMRQLLDNAAREGARLAVVGTDRLTTQDIRDCVTRRMAGQTLSNMSIQVYKADLTTGSSIGSWTDAALGDGIAVTISGIYQPLIPVKFAVPMMSTPITLLTGPRPMSAKAVMFSEAN
jgi:Flp pilus assembly protein TadG